EIGAVVCTIEEGGKQEGAAPSKEESTSEAKTEVSASSNGASASPSESQETYAAGSPSPAAAKILKERGIDPKNIKGTGKDGRITKEDALNASDKPSAAPKEKVEAPASGSPSASESVAGARNEKREKMSSLRKTIAKRLVTVKNETAMLTTFNEVDMKPIMDLRAKYKDKFKEKYGIGLGFMSFFTKAVCQALKEWPAVNAQIDGDEIVYHDYCDISIAVSTPRGLVVPVVRNATTRPFAQIESVLARLAVRARDGKLSSGEMQGGTFSFTNGGVFGSMLSTPILNPPQAAILG